MRERSVVFGAGQVGSPLARMLLERGHDVRVVKRSAGGIPNGAQPVLGDAANLPFCIEAAAGATTVYHCMNPPYSTKVWADLVPRYMANLIEASARAGARLVALDNVYMLGKPDGRPLTDNTPMNPCSRKGEIRARAAHALFDAHRRGDLRAIEGRASDFYGPGGRLTLLGDYFWPRVFKGRSGQVLMNPDVPHTYHYIPDVAAGLATLGGAPDDAFGKPWMLPCRPVETFRDLVRRLERPLGKPIGLTIVPGWIQRAMSVFMPVLRETAEMGYQWEEPFVIDDSPFRQRFGAVPEDADRAAAATVAWARTQYAAT
ncbi:MAG TPA: NAD-dependent epimerase/dehydratase family protein [Vicinamibacterales bacterium]|nr:NAD-dependent epimerase/dehydratase family protein [Vicinamibacterales bacterium]